MAFPALIQKTVANPSSASTQTQVILSQAFSGAPVQAGDAIIVLASSQLGNNFTVTGVTDSQGNTYTQITGAAVGQNSPSAVAADIWWTPSVASSGNLTVTVTFSGSAFNPVTLLEVSNLSGATASAGHVSGINVTGGSTFQGPSLNGSTEALFVAVAAGSEDAVPVLSPWAMETTDAGTGHTGVAIAPYFHGTQQPTFIATGNASSFFQGVVSGAVFVLSSSTFNLSGNAGVAGATVSYSGPQGSGSTTADGSGNYSFANLNPGNYTITPSKAGYQFSPFSQVVSLSATTSGVNFTASLLWSPKDCRVSPEGPNTGVQQPSLAVFYTGQTSSDSLVPGTDSRAAGAPTDSRTAGAPINSRKNPSP